MQQGDLVQASVSYHGLGRDDETVEVEEGTTFDAFLREREIHPETVLVFVDDDVVPEETEIPAGADVRVLRIISGGAGAPAGSPKRS